MEKPAPILLHKFNSSSTNLSYLKKDEAQILHLYDGWEKYLHFIKANNKKWKQDKEALDSIRILSDIENLWIKYRKQIHYLKNEDYEPISLIQYRMMQFIQKRQEFRKNVNNEQNEISDNENSDIPLVSKNINPENKEMKQISLTTFLEK